MARSKETNLIIRLRQDVSKLRQDQKKTMAVMRRHKNELNSFGRQMQRTFVGAFSAYAAIGTIKAMTAAYDKQEKAIAQVRQGLLTTGAVSGKTLDELKEKASALQKETLFGDEEILEGATAQLLTFTNIANREFDRTQKAVLDVSTRLNQDLKSTAIQLGKALNDPVANLGALSRSGIQFTKAQKAVIKEMAETNRIAEAQSLILDELERQYGGSAMAAAKAGTGGFKQLGNDIGDLSEELGRLVAGNSGDSGLIGWIRSVTQEMTKATHQLNVGVVGVEFEKTRKEIALLGSTQGALDTMKGMIANSKIKLEQLNIELKKSEERGYLYSGVADMQRKSIELLNGKIEIYKQRQKEITVILARQAEETRRLDEERRKLANQKIEEKNNKVPAFNRLQNNTPGIGRDDTTVGPVSIALKQAEEFRLAKEQMINDAYLMQQEMDMIINHALASFASNVIQATVINGMEGGFAAILDAMGDGLIRLGEAAIAHSAIMKTIKTSLSNPFGSIALGLVGGAAAIAAGTLLKQQAASINRATLSSAGGGGGASGPSERFQNNRKGQSMVLHIKGETKLSGRDVVIVYDQQKKLDQRLTG